MLFKECTTKFKQILERDTEISDTTIRLATLMFLLIKLRIKTRGNLLDAGYRLVRKNAAI